MAPSANTLLSSGYNEIAAGEKQYKETVDDTLTHGLSGPEVHRRALEARKLFGKAQKALAFWINEIDARKIYREFGCSSIYHYATTHLALGEHTIAEMVRTGKALEHLPLLSQAYERVRSHLHTYGRSPEWQHLRRRASGMKQQRRARPARSRSSLPSA